MAKYRKKPVVIDAVQYMGGNDREINAMLGCDIRSVYCEGHPERTSAQIDTLEGQMKASIGDWIIKGIQGELYPCKPDIFEATYELVDP